MVETVACNRLTAKFMGNQDHMDIFAAINRALLNVSGPHKDTDVEPSLPEVPFHVLFGAKKASLWLLEVFFLTTKDTHVHAGNISCLHKSSILISIYLATWHI